MGYLLGVSVSLFELRVFPREASSAVDLAGMLRLASTVGTDLDENLVMVERDWVWCKWVELHVIELFRFGVFVGGG